MEGHRKEGENLEMDDTTKAPDSTVKVDTTKAAAIPVKADPPKEEVKAATTAPIQRSIRALVLHPISTVEEFADAEGLKTWLANQPFTAHFLVDAENIIALNPVKNAVKMLGTKVDDFAVHAIVLIEGELSQPIKDQLKILVSTLATDGVGFIKNWLSPEKLAAIPTDETISGIAWNVLDSTEGIVPNQEGFDANTVMEGLRKA
jgi:hypothetical protein